MPHPYRLLLLFAVASQLVLAAIASAQGGVQRSTFGTTPEGATVEAFTLTNATGASAKIITYGAIVADLKIPDRDGKLVSVVREITASEAGFQKGFREAAAVFGRVANRIAGAQFTLDGKVVSVTRNAGQNHIHGGTKNFSR
ncbi:MAG: galactose-1-epimerase, partial [Opitutaceae bacterium]